MSSLVLPMADPLQIVSFVHRGCKGELVGQDWQRMNELLVELTPENLSTTLEKCYDNHRSQRMFYVYLFIEFIIPSCYRFYHCFFIVLLSSHLRLFVVCICYV